MTEMFDCKVEDLKFTRLVQDSSKYCIALFIRGQVQGYFWGDFAPIKTV